MRTSPIVWLLDWLRTVAVIAISPRQFFSRYPRNKPAHRPFAAITVVLVLLITVPAVGMVYLEDEDVEEDPVGDALQNLSDDELGEQERAEAEALEEAYESMPSPDERSGTLWDTIDTETMALIGIFLLILIPVVIGAGMFSYIAGASIIGYVLDKVYLAMGGVMNNEVSSFDVLFYTYPVYLPSLLLRHILPFTSGVITVSLILLALITFLWAVSVQIRSFSTIYKVGPMRILIPFIPWILFTLQGLLTALN